MKKITRYVALVLLACLAAFGLRHGADISGFAQTALSGRLTKAISLALGMSAALAIAITLLWKPLRAHSPLLAGGGDKKPLFRPCAGTPPITRAWIVAYALLFLALFGTRAFFVAQKEGLHVDEGLSVTLASYNEYGWTRNYPADRDFSGKELKELTYWDDPSISGAFADVVRLYLDNRDAPHTNFYYSILRLWCVGVKSGELRTLISHGCSLNLLLFSASFLLMLFLARRLAKNDVVAWVVLFLAFANAGSVSNALFIRPYQLQETMMIAVTLIFAAILQCEREGRDYESWQNVALISGTCALFLLSGYFGTVYLAFLCIVLLASIVSQRRFGAMLFWTTVLVATVVTVTALYPRYFLGAGGSRARQSMRLFSVAAILENTMASASGLKSILTSFFMYVPAIGAIVANLAVIILVAKKSNRHTAVGRGAVALTLFACALVWCALVVFLSPNKILRYVMPAFPLLSLMFIGLLEASPPATAKVASAIYTAVFSLGLVASSLGPMSPIPRYATIENLYPGKNAYEFTQTPGKAVIIVNSNIWKYAELIPYLDDGQRYWIADTVEAALRYADKGKADIIACENDLLAALLSRIDRNPTIKPHEYFTVIESPPRTVPNTQ